MKEIFQWINNIYPQSPECLAYLESIIQPKSVKKGENLLIPGQISTELYFIKKGLLKDFYYDDETPVVDWFFWEGETVVSVQSYYEQVPGRNFIQAMEDSELYYVNHEQYQFLNNNFLEFNYVARVLITKYFLIWHKLAECLKLKTVEERYLKILQIHPKLLQRVPLKDIAAYLSTSPETLSRIRSQSRY